MLSDDEKRAIEEQGKIGARVELLDRIAQVGQNAMDDIRVTLIEEGFSNAALEEQWSKAKTVIDASIRAAYTLGDHSSGADPAEAGRRAGDRAIGQQKDDNQLSLDGLLERDVATVIELESNATRLKGPER